MVIALIVLLVVASLHLFAGIRRHETMGADATLTTLAVVLAVLGLVEEFRIRRR